jgi:hypothetical protein
MAEALTWFWITAKSLEKGKKLRIERGSYKGGRIFDDGMF